MIHPQNALIAQFAMMGSGQLNHIALKTILHLGHYMSHQLLPILQRLLVSDLIINLQLVVIIFLRINPDSYLVVIAAIRV